MTADSTAKFDIRDAWRDMETSRSSTSVSVAAKSGLAASSNAAFNRSNEGDEDDLQMGSFAVVHSTPKQSRTNLNSSTSLLKEPKSMAGVTAISKEKKTRKAGMNYKKATVHMDTMLMMYYLQYQLYHAKRVYDDRQSSLLTIQETMERMSVRMYITQDLCEMTCRTESFPIRLYIVMFPPTEEQLYRRALLTPHMFMKKEASAVASHFGLILNCDVDRALVHVCSHYCPYQIRVRTPELFGTGTSNLDNDDDDADKRKAQEDQDAVWADERWHLQPVKLAEITIDFTCAINSAMPPFVVVTRMYVQSQDKRSPTSRCINSETVSALLNRWRRPTSTRGSAVVMVTATQTSVVVARRLCALRYSMLRHTW
jgi:hypothetical protein